MARGQMALNGGQFLGRNVFFCFLNALWKIIFFAFGKMNFLEKKWKKKNSLRGKEMFLKNIRKKEKVNSKKDSR